jgi:hypothetical protein
VLIFDLIGVSLKLVFGGFSPFRRHDGSGVKKNERKMYEELWIKKI